MDEILQPLAHALQLLLACARAHPTPEHETAIRELLSKEVDWTLFVRKAVTHGLAGLAGHTLGRVAPDLVPEEILGAFQAFIAQTRKSNLVLLEELARLIERLAAAGVTTIPFKGPVLTQQAFGDLGLRGFRDLDFLIRDEDLAPASKVLHDFGYARQGNLTETQFNLIHWLQGQEILFKKDAGAIEPHTRLTSVKMALGIDYEGLWSRAQRADIFGHEMLTLSPEDTLLVLAIHGGKELWWDIKWACDIADFIAAHPGLDWTAIVARARAQGCYRMLLVATALSRKYLGANIPATLTAAEAGDPAIWDIIGRIMMRWEADDPGGPPSNKTLSMDRLRLHDGVFRRASYVVRTLLLPGPQHVPLVALPKSLGFAYIPIGIAHDLIALPLYRAYEWALVESEPVKDVLAVSPLVLALSPVPAGEKQRRRQFQRMHRKARKAVTRDPSNAVAWAAMGDAFAGLKRYRQSVACYDKALAIVPDHNAVWKQRAAAVTALHGTDRADDQGPAFDSGTADGWALRAGFLAAYKHYAEAAKASESALRLDPCHEIAARIGINARLQVCDWSRREADRKLALDGVKSGTVVIKPFSLKLMSNSEEESFALAQLWSKGYARADDRILWQGERYDHDRIRIAYISTDFRRHPVGDTIIAPLEQHDRSRFEITAISTGPDDASQTRRRIQGAVDHFVDARNLRDGQVAQMLREMEIDIAVDLNGLTGAKRLGILAQRPAPVQVNYLGYPGTTAASYIDYIIADPVLIPPAHQGFYSEKVAYLPNCYLPYDPSRKLATAPQTRAQRGLPETGFVFASFNNLAKLTPEMFDVWTRLLHQVEGSVLWMSRTDKAAVENLRREASARGISPERVIYAQFEKDLHGHLARQQLADLFLDTFPYNAHSTCGDALWAGLPVLTLRGEVFQARVAASLLEAVGLPELITTSMAEYEDLALALARDPVRLAAIRQKLARNRDQQPLFDIARFTRGLEAIYAAMWQRQRAGRKPESFSVS